MFVYIGDMPPLCACSAPSDMPVTSQLLRGLSRTKVLASSLLPCQQHQSKLEPVTHQPACRWLSGVWKSCQHSRSYQTSSVLCSYILTPPQVNSILKANEYSFKVRAPFHEYKKEKNTFLQLGKQVFPSPFLCAVVVVGA